LYGRLDLANAYFADANSREREMLSVDPRDSQRRRGGAKRGPGAGRDSDNR